MGDDEQEWQASEDARAIAEMEMEAEAEAGNEAMEEAERKNMRDDMLREVARKMNTVEYSHEDDAIKNLGIDLKKEGIVVVFGYSDDNIEFRGAIDDEVGSYGGTEVKFNKKGLVQNKCDDETCPYFDEIEMRTKSKVIAEWDKEGYSWYITTTVNCVSFTIMEDGQRYCHGIVFFLSDGDDAV